MSVAVHYLEDIRGQFGKIKKHVEDALAQVTDDDLNKPLDPESNSLALILKHMAGNMRSRFTDFLTSDGEKPDRDRDSEFVEEILPREQILSMWERGWACVFDAVASMKGDDLSRTVTVRLEPMTAAAAIARQVAHYGYHVGQITLLGKHFVGKDWKYITIPRGGTKDFNRRMGMERGKSPA